MEHVRTRGLSASGLKWIALGLMVLDHIHYFFAYTGWAPEWFSMAGGRRCSCSAWRRALPIPMTGEAIS